jgi:hypothetical protein
MATSPTNDSSSFTIHKRRKVSEELENVDATCLGEADPGTSPTGVNDERLLLPDPNDSSSETKNADQSFLPIIPVSIQQQAIDTYFHVHDFVQDQQKNFVLDRKAITTLILSFLASAVGFLGVAIASIGGLLVVSCPIWLPIALLTAPLWLPVLLFTSPVWVTVLATVACCVVGTCSFVVAVALFFTWPEEWLPAKESSDVVQWYLRHRDTATLALAKLQAKFLLYAAGIGPAADAIFVVVDRIDVQAFTSKLGEVDWKDLSNKIQKGELQEVTSILLRIASSLIH